MEYVFAIYCIGFIAYLCLCLWAIRDAAFYADEVILVALNVFGSALLWPIALPMALFWTWYNK